MGCQLCKDFFEPGEVRVNQDVVGITAQNLMAHLKLELVHPDRISMGAVEIEAATRAIFVRKNPKFPREGSLEFDSNEDSYLLRTLLHEPIGRFYIHDYSKAKMLTDVETRVKFLSLLYKLAVELEMEARIAPFPLPPQQESDAENVEEEEKAKDKIPYPFETDEERYERLDGMLRDLVEVYLSPTSHLHELTQQNAKETQRWDEAKAKLDQLGVANVLRMGREVSHAMRCSVLAALQPLAHCSFTTLVDNGTISEFRNRSAHKRYVSKFSNCYNNINHEAFDFMSVLGKGSFGRVLRVRKKTTQKQYAMKIMSKRKILSGAENAAQVTIERNVLVECNHPNIVKVNYAFHTSRALFLVLDLLEGGTLITAMNQCGGMLPMDICSFFIAQIILGLEHLHDHGILFRDLKPLNVLLDRKGNAVLTDMGLACKFRDHKPGVLFNTHVNAKRHEGETEERPRRQSIPILPKEKLKCVGTYGFRAPELMNTETDRTTGYGPPVDYFALGVTLCYVACGKMPFRQRNQPLIEAREKPKDTERRLQKLPPRIPTELAEECQDMIRGLVRLDPLERYGDADLPALKRHSFFKGIDWNKLANGELKSPYQPTSIKRRDKNELPQFPSVHAAMHQFAHENVLEMFGGENEMKDEYTHVPKAEQKHFRTWDFIPEAALEMEWDIIDEQIRTQAKPFPRKRKVPEGKIPEESAERLQELRAISFKTAAPAPQQELKVVDG